MTRYFVKHLDVHRSADAFNFVTQQTDQVRVRLNQTEDELKRLKGLAGITSLAESTMSVNADLLRTRDALQTAEAEQAEQKARIAEMEKSPSRNTIRPRLRRRNRRPSNPASQRFSTTSHWLNDWTSFAKGKWSCSRVMSRNSPSNPRFKR